MGKAGHSYCRSLFSIRNMGDFYIDMPQCFFDLEKQVHIIPVSFLGVSPGGPWT